MKNCMENDVYSNGRKEWCANFLLQVISDVAERNADSLCRGWMYEPEIPEKLKKRR